ncbi:hypothetical protein [Ureibacillus manganicus]|uniref:Uncharacterized protein n=1 Tax=Ureibacillus manganicus DSM 26584 TaxID=1384049 RepID=A0A0A3IFL9_9BACL|nr:hypothetical protein [Ureibacillus manganicus]KGR73652.1 hypothetical protein CD29_19175 [Ureibacillus manganicus DSM 26584]
MLMITIPKPETKKKSKVTVEKRNLVKAKRVTQLSECSMSQSSKKIKDLNEKVMKYIANQ